MSALNSHSCFDSSKHRHVDHWVHTACLPVILNRHGDNANDSHLSNPRQSHEAVWNPHKFSLLLLAMLRFTTPVLGFVIFVYIYYYILSILLLYIIKMGHHIDFELLGQIVDLPSCIPQFRKNRLPWTCTTSMLPPCAGNPLWVSYVTASTYLLQRISQCRKLAPLANLQFWRTHSDNSPLKCSA